MMAEATSRHKGICKLILEDYGHDVVYVKGLWDLYKESIPEDQHIMLGEIWEEVFPHLKMITMN